MLQAAIYARFSSDLQRERSIEDQVELCRSYAVGSGFAVAQVFDDRARSGSTLVTVVPAAMPGPATVAAAPAAFAAAKVAPAAAASAAETGSVIAGALTGAAIVAVLVVADVLAPVPLDGAGAIFESFGPMPVRIVLICETLSAMSVDKVS